MYDLERLLKYLQVKTQGEKECGGLERQLSAVGRFVRSHIHQLTPSTDVLSVSEDCHRHTDLI